MQIENLPSRCLWEAPPRGGADVTMIDANAKQAKLDMKWVVMDSSLRFVSNFSLASA